MDDETPFVDGKAYPRALVERGFVEQGAGIAVKVEEHPARPGGDEIVGSKYVLSARHRQTLETFFNSLPEKWRIPPGFRVFYYPPEPCPSSADKTSAAWKTEVVQEPSLMSGAAVDSASVRLDPDTNRYYIDVGLSPSATGDFADASTRHVGRKLAMVIDGLVLIAPTIQEPILGGQLRIDVGAENYAAD